MSYEAPTLNWNATDYYNCTDWNRVENNTLAVAAFLTANGFSVADTPITAADFSGSGYVSIPDYLALHVGSIFTVMAWIKPGDAMTTREYLFSTRYGNPTGCWDLEIGSITGTAAGIGVATPGVVNATTANNVLVQGMWQHVAYVRNGASQTIYLNGQNLTLVINSPQALADNTNPKMIAVLENPVGTFGSFFNGELIEVGLWNAALTQAQIQQYMEQKLAGTESGLVGYWPLQEGSGSVATNQAGNPGGITNGTWTPDLSPMGLATITDRTTASLDFYDSLSRIESNIAVLGAAFEAAEGFLPPSWSAPVTNWTYDMSFSYVDANRLENNIDAIYSTLYNIVFGDTHICGSPCSICGEDGTYV